MSGQFIRTIIRPKHRRKSAAHPTNNRVCISTPRPNSKWRPSANSSYVYGFSIMPMRTIYPVSNLHITVFYFPICQLKTVSLKESDPLDGSARSLAAASSQFADSLQRNPLIFAFQDGQVEDVCTEGHEEPWVLNVKRGIISSLQNSMRDTATSQTVYEVKIAPK